MRDETRETIDRFCFKLCICWIEPLDMAGQYPPDRCAMRLRKIILQIPSEGLKPAKCASHQYYELVRLSHDAISMPSGSECPKVY